MTRCVCWGIYCLTKVFGYTKNHTSLNPTTAHITYIENIHYTVHFDVVV
jgi:hypothetical protein